VVVTLIPLIKDKISLAGQSDVDSSRILFFVYNELFGTNATRVFNAILAADNSLNQDFYEEEDRVRLDMNNKGIQALQGFASSITLINSAKKTEHMTADTAKAEVLNCLAPRFKNKKSNNNNNNNNNTNSGNRNKGKQNNKQGNKNHNDNYNFNNDDNIATVSALTITNTSSNNTNTDTKGNGRLKCYACKNQGFEFNHDHKTCPLSLALVEMKKKKKEGKH